MKTKIYLIRHTQVVGNIENRFTGRIDSDVTQKGKEYIDELTERLKGVKFDKAYSSSTPRTRKTIQKLADMNHLTIEESQNLCEMDFGDYDGKRWEEIDEINPEVRRIRDMKNELTHIPHQETMEHVASRMYKEITDISKKDDGKTILICSHGVAIEAFLRKITGDPFAVKREEYGQRNTTINVLEYDDTKNSFDILILNDYSHIMNEKQKDDDGAR